MVINPIAGVYIPIIRIPIKGWMTIPNQEFRPWLIWGDLVGLVAMKFAQKFPSSASSIMLMHRHILILLGFYLTLSSNVLTWQNLGPLLKVKLLVGYNWNPKLKGAKGIRLT